MSEQTKITVGIILLTMPTIQYGGFFLLKILSGKTSAPFTDFQKSMFRAGHAHAGVLVILAIIAQFLIDASNVSASVTLFLRLGFTLSPVMISGGFFASAVGIGLVKPNALIKILYFGVALLAVVLIYLGVVLIKSA